VNQRRIQLQAHHKDINKLPMQVKLAGESPLLDETILLIQVDGGKIIDAHTQVYLSNRISLPVKIRSFSKITGCFFYTR